MNLLFNRLGRRVRELRKKSGLTQEQLGERAGLHQTFIGGIERGKRNVSLETLVKLAEALNISLYEMFIFTDITTKSKSVGELLKPMITGKDRGMEAFFFAFCSHCKYYNSYVHLEGVPDVLSFFSICCRNCDPYQRFHRFLSKSGPSAS